MINACLLMAGAIALAGGVLDMWRGARHSDQNGYSCVLGLFAFIWCVGLTWVGIEDNPAVVLWLRVLGCAGVLGFFVTEILWIWNAAGGFSKYNRQLKLVLVIAALVDFVLLVSLNVPILLRGGKKVHDRAAFTCTAILQVLFVIVMLTCIWVMLFKMVRKTQFRREQWRIHKMMQANICLDCLLLADVILFSCGKTALSVSGIGAAAASLVFGYTQERYRSFQVTPDNLGQYLYQYAELPVLVFALDGTITVVNPYGRTFFGIESKEIRRLSDVFMISEEAGRVLFEERDKTKQSDKANRYRTYFDGKTCSLSFIDVNDSYGEPLVVLGIVKDCSQETQNLQEIRMIREEMQKKVTEKTQEAEWAVFQSITSMANAIDAKDEYTKGHSVRVAEYSEDLARAIGWNAEQIEKLHYIALLHDVGKIGVPDSVLNKPEKLSQLEIELIQSHTTIGGEILKDVTMVEHLAAGAMYHHERYDGAGYPAGLKGEEIPVEARIICIADAYDAMNTDRVYRKRLPKDVILQQLTDGKGKQFDPDLVDDFLILLSTGKITGEEPVLEKRDPDRMGHMLQDMIQKNIQKKKDAEQNAEQNDEEIQKQKDFLTGVWKKSAGEKKIEKIMQTEVGYLAVLDIDNLRRVNQAYGHLTGDYALKILSQILLKYGTRGIAVRYGGDEFVFFLKAKRQEEAEKIMDEILYSYKCQRDLNPKLKRTSLSAGLCVTHLGDSYERIYQSASRVLYNVKQTGKNSYRFFKEAALSTENRSAQDLRQLIVWLREKKTETPVSMEEQELNRICKVIRRYINNHLQSEQKLQIVMITIQYREGEESTLERQEYLMNALMISIMENVPDLHSTIRYSGLQYLILIQKESEEVAAIVNQVFKRFYKICNDRNADVSYDRTEYQMKEDDSVEG